MSIQPDSKTVVIGVGGAGSDIVGRLKAVVEDEGYSSDDFLYMALDSRKVRDIGVEDKWTIRLDWGSRTEWQRKQESESYHYLDKSDDPPSNEGGVDRNRPAARGVLDDDGNISSVIANLKSAVDAFAGNATNVDIWVVNSLGGGTGSGSQPMLLALLQALEQAEFGRMNLFGLSTVPQLDIEPDTLFPGSIDVEAVPNAFGALSELRQLVDVAAYEQPPELEIELGLDTGKVELFRSMEGESLPLTRDRLEGYYLLGIDEDRIEAGDESYEEVIESTAALTILAQSIASENFPDREEPKFADRLLRTVDAVACSFPYSDVTEYVADATRDQWLEDQAGALSDVDETFESNESLLQEVSKLRQGDDESVSDRVDNLVTYVSNQLGEPDDLRYLNEMDAIRQKMRQSVSQTDDEISYLADEFDIDDLEDVDEEYRPESPSTWLAAQTDDDLTQGREELSPALLVLEYLFYIELDKQVQLKKRLAEDEFQDEVDALFDEVRGKMDSEERDDFNDSNGYETKWQDELSPFVDVRIDDVREGGLIRSGDEERATELANWQSDIDDALRTVADFESVEDEIGSLLVQTHTRLRNLLEWYDDEREAIATRKANIEKSQQSIEGGLENVASRLSTPSGEKFRTIQIADPDQIVTKYFTEGGKNSLEVIDELIEEYGLGSADNPTKAAIRHHLRTEISIQELEQSGIIEAANLEMNLRDTVNRLEERVADNGSIQNSVILPIEYDDDDWLTAIGNPNGNYSNTLLQGLTLAPAKIAEAKNQVSGGVPGVIKFLFVNPDVTLDDASEYTTIKNWYEDGVLGEKIGADYENPAAIVNVAYPELADIATENLPTAGKQPVDEE